MKEEMSANMYSGRKVHPVSVFSADVAGHDAGSDQLGKVVHGKSGKGLLKDVLHFFCVEGRKANGVFELAKGGLNAPTGGIELLKGRRRELNRIKVGSNGFANRFRNSETDDAQVKCIKKYGIVFSGIQRQEVKNNRVADQTVLISLLEKGFCLIGLPAGKG